MLGTAFAVMLGVVTLIVKAAKSSTRPESLKPPLTEGQ